MPLLLPQQEKKQKYKVYDYYMKTLLILQIKSSAFSQPYVTDEFLNHVTCVDMPFISKCTNHPKNKKHQEYISSKRF